MNKKSKTAPGIVPGKTYDGMMHTTYHERAAWRQLAMAAYAAERPALGDRISDAAIAHLPLAEFDFASAAYRDWLNFGFLGLAKEGVAK